MNIPIVEDYDLVVSVEYSESNEPQTIIPKAVIDLIKSTATLIASNSSIKKGLLLAYITMNPIGLRRGIETCVIDYLTLNT